VGKWAGAAVAVLLFVGWAATVPSSLPISNYSVECITPRGSVFLIDGSIVWRHGTSRFDVRGVFLRKGEVLNGRVEWYNDREHRERRIEYFLYRWNVATLRGRGSLRRYGFDWPFVIRPTGPFAYLSVPLWLPFAFVVGAVAVLRYRDRERRVPAGHCGRCGYDL